LDFKAIVKCHWLYLSALTSSRATLKMTVLQQISNPYLASLILGLLYGLTFCTSACLPYILSYIAGIGAGFRKGVIVTTIYNSGRIVAYALIGTAAGLLSAIISEEVFLSYQNYSSIAFAAVIVVIGVTILLKKSAACTCAIKQSDLLGVSKLTQRFDIRAFFMGFTRGLILCPPLIAVILYAVTFSQLDCTILAVLFGVGTALSPLMFLGGATGWLLNKAPLFRKWLSRIGGTVLIFMGLMLLLNALLAVI
jgi:sulfite exporter TauE/SafE